MQFAERFRLLPPEPPIAVERDAPNWFINDMIALAQEFGFDIHRMRKWLLDKLLIFDQRTYDYNIAHADVVQKLRTKGWYLTFELVEKVHEELVRRGEINSVVRFDDKINRYTKAKGVGWKFVGGQWELRGSQVLEEVIKNAIEIARASGKYTFETELHEALVDLSRRPKPEVSGAIQHSMAALECLARGITNESSLTLGEWIKKHGDKFPRPLDVVVEKLWGYASEYGRHRKEGVDPTPEEAELVIGLVGAFSTYLLRKQPAGA